MGGAGGWRLWRAEAHGVPEGVRSKSGTWSEVEGRCLSLELSLPRGWLCKRVAEEGGGQGSWGRGGPGTEKSG